VLGVGGVGGGGGQLGPGDANTGGGGGGGTGAGGSGIVVVRYPGSVQYFTGGTVTYAAGYVVHKFYVTGILAPTAPTVLATSDYQISRSLRFNSADSANLSRTFGTPTNANVWTFSCWIKRSALGAYSTILGRSGNTYPTYQFNATTNTFGVFDSGSTATTAVFRDPSAWYHLVIQRTDSTTVTVYFNKALVVEKKALSAKAFSFTVNLIEEKINELVLYAENLGAIAPNTALMIINDGVTKYQVKLSSDFKNNASVKFELKK
jgi:hypothetical protein